jgi:hypothetical protein
MLVETPVAGLQVNVDGYVLAGDVRLLGVVDEELYPDTAGGARHFARFSYPSALPAAVQQRCFELTRRLVQALGLRHGFFNCELFVLPDGSLRLIEINPRLATQFAGIYRHVVGFDVHAALVALGRGLDPEPVARREPCAGAGASFVFRRFDGRPGPCPARSARTWLRRAHPDAELTLYSKRGGALRREYKWLGSHRYGVLNLAARDPEALAELGARIAGRLGWPAPADGRAAVSARS